jgi:hypothetical protein
MLGNLHGIDISGLGNQELPALQQLDHDPVL